MRHVLDTDIDGAHDVDVACCAASTIAREGTAPTLPLEALDDEEGEAVDRDLPPVIDAHVHVFPDGIFRAVWRWFDNYGWPVRYKLYADDVVAHLLEKRGVTHAVLLHYAHKPGIARFMNEFVAGVVARHSGVTGLATVAPDDDDKVAILEEAFALGLRGVKLHTHVQAVAADDARLFPIYELCQARDLPVVIHAGRAPHSEHLPVDPRQICDVARLERVLRAWPRLRVCVPHLGADEFAAYADLLAHADNLWLDTTMMLAGYLPGVDDDVELVRFLRVRPDRIMYGTDFPNIPFAWDRELRRIVARRGRLTSGALEALLGGNARALFGIP